MSDKELLKWAILVDVAILIVLSYDTYIAYQFYKQQKQQQGGH